MAITFSYDDDSVAAIDRFLSGAQQPGLRAHPLFAPRRPVRREGALPGCGRGVSRLRHARAEQRVLAGPVDAGHRGLSQGRLHRSWCSKASANTWRCTTTAPTFWSGRNKADYPNIAKELKINLKDVATYFHANAQKSKKPDEYLEAARWYRTYLDSFPDDPDSFGTNYLLSETLYEARDYQGASAEFTRTAYNYPRNPRSAAAAYAALGSYTKYEEALPAAQKAEAHKAAVDAGIKFGTSFPEHPDSAVC